MKETNPRIGQNIFHQSQSGSTLIATVILLLITGVVAYGYLLTASHESYDSTRNYTELKAFWKAEEGLSMALAMLADSEKLLSDTLMGFTEPEYKNPIEKEKQLVAMFTAKRHDKGSVFHIKSIVFWAGDIDGDTLQVLSMEASAASVSSTFLFFDKPGQAYFFTGDTIDGPVHSNGGINVAGSPVFTDVVEREPLGITGYRCAQGYPCSPEFQKDLKPSTPWEYSQFADRIEKNADLSLTVPSGVAEIVLEGSEMHLRYRTNLETIDRKTGALLARTYTNEQKYSLENLNGVYIHGNVEIKGELSGRFTLGASGTISITGDLVYTDSDPETGKPAENSNFLGLIARKNVELRKPLEEAQNDGGMRLNAAIIALDSAFETPLELRRVGNYGVLKFWGSLAQRVRGAVGFNKSSRIGEGYTRKSWHFDRRLLRDSPPLFPDIAGTGRSRPITVTYWSRQW